MAEWNSPAGLTKAVEAALTAGRSFLVRHGEDLGENPFVEFTVKWEECELRVAWHTRGTGTYRLFSAMLRTGTHNWNHVTLTKAIEAIRA